jgi:hypothetical protein
LDRLGTADAIVLMANEIAFLTQVPEPSTALMLGGGLLAFAVRLRGRFPLRQPCC